MCGTIGASRRSTVPGHWSRPEACSPCSLPLANITCMPTQMPRTGRPPARRRSIMRGPPTSRSWRMTAAKAPTPGTTRPSASATSSGSEVSSTCAPACSRARTAERTLPEPWSRTTTFGWLVTGEVYPRRRACGAPVTGASRLPAAQPLGEHARRLPPGQVARALVAGDVGDPHPAQDDVLHDVVGAREDEAHRDLLPLLPAGVAPGGELPGQPLLDPGVGGERGGDEHDAEIGRAACRERVGLAGGGVAGRVRARGGVA